MGSVRVAIVGVGNCAASLVQGVEYYREADPTETRVPGLMHVQMLGGYHVSRPRVRGRVRRRRQAKVGTDLGEGHRSPVRTTPSGSPRWVPARQSPCNCGARPYDGFGKYYRETVEESPAEPVDVVAALRDSRADVLVSYLPVGIGSRLQRFYAQMPAIAGRGRRS